MYLTSTCVLDEVRLAIQNVYEVLDIIEVYEYEVTKYEPHTRGRSIFGLYKHVP